MSRDDASLLRAMTAEEVAIVLEQDPDFRLPAWVPGRRRTMCQARQILAGVGLDDVNGDGIEAERIRTEEAA